jgi:hypothetical protein
LRSWGRGVRYEPREFNVVSSFERVEQFLFKSLAPQSNEIVPHIIVSQLGFDGQQLLKMLVIGETRFFEFETFSFSQFSQEITDHQIFVVNLSFAAQVRPLKTEW